MITQDELKKQLSYDPTTGKFIRVVALCNRIRIGDVAGTPNGRGYIKLRVNARSPVFAHRLAWLYVYGYFPKELDHINGNRSDNRIENLREVDRKQNCENQKLRSTNKTGFRGVYWNKLEQKYKAQVGHNRELHHLGTFDNLKEAVQAVRDFRNVHYTHDKTDYSA